MGRLEGRLEVRIICPDLTEFINSAIHQNIVFYFVEICDIISGKVVIRRADLKKLQTIAVDYNGDISVIKDQKSILARLTFWKRPVLSIGILILLFLTVFLPTRILFVSVRGNEQLPDSYIIGKAVDCGVYFGASRKYLRSEQVKNRLIAALPELSWIGVNTVGCVAVISVRENAPEPAPKSLLGVGNVVASHDGIITSCTVTRGNRLCAPGQAVKAGQVLISGYYDHGICIVATQAAGEVYALTQRSITTAVLQEAQLRTQKTFHKKLYSVRIGNRLIKLYESSDFPEAFCAVSYTESPLTLPGGFGLPMSLIAYTVTGYDTETAVPDPQSLEWLQESSDGYLLANLNAGKIYHRRYEFDGSGQQVASYICLEMIGKQITEEIVETYDKTG